MHEELIQTEFQGTPCPLLRSQLETAIVFAERFRSQAEKLVDLLKKDGQ